MGVGNIFYSFPVQKTSKLCRVDSVSVINQYQCRARRLCLLTWDSLIVERRGNITPFNTRKKNIQSTWLYTSSQYPPPRESSEAAGTWFGCAVSIRQLAQLFCFPPFQEIKIWTKLRNHCLAFFISPNWLTSDRPTVNKPIKVSSPWRIVPECSRRADMR